MNRVKAYEEIEAELRRWQQMPWEHFARFIGGPPVVAEITPPEGRMLIETRITREEDGSLRIHVCASSLSSFRLERIEESAARRRETSESEPR